MNSTKPDPDTPARHWLSQGFEELAVRCEGKDDATALDFDVVIVGSGYGAAVAAYHLAGKAVDGKALSVAILERGGEYLNGMFPADPGDLVPQLRWALPGSSKAQGSQEGLFDIRFGPGITSIVANGLGGGSLINAGVMLRPRPAVFDTGWPADLDYQSLESHFETCEALLRARPLPHRVTKFEALNRLSSANRVPITIATDAGDEQPACTLCGNCVTGCNFGAKLSLDISLLARAMELNDQVECFTGATVLKFWQEKTHHHNPTWCVDAGFTNEDLANRLQAPVTIRCRYLIIAAGTFGSTELLMRSEHQELGFSPVLGKGFSMNGDLLAFGYGQKALVKAIARQPGEFDVTFDIGPTITGCIDYRDDRGILLEELAVPYSLYELFEQVLATSVSIHNLTETSLARHQAGFGFTDEFSIDSDTMDASAIYALMGDDGACGEIPRPVGGNAEGTAYEGTAYASWPDLGKHRLFRQQMTLLDELVTNSEAGGKVISNPLWRLLPDALGYLAPENSGPLLTVHPLGGCAMADSGREGVVDHLGRVFVGNRREYYPNLCVLDGSVIPKALGVNPALTIAAISLRAVESLSVIWGFKRHSGKPTTLPARPDFQIISGATRRRTEVQLHERLVGDLMVDTSEGPRDYTMEITLASSPCDLAALHHPHQRVLTIAPTSRVRLFPAGRYEAIMNSGADDETIRARLLRRAVVTMQVSGEILLFTRQGSSPLRRISRTMAAWFLNRGLRDLYQAFRLRDHGQSFWMQLNAGAARAKDIVRLASHAGEKREIIYRLHIDSIQPGRGPALLARKGDRILGRKTLTYGRAPNPLRQMMEMTLEVFPGLNRARTCLLAMDPRYLARISVPLLGVTRQTNLPATIVAFVGLAGYVLRMILTIHALTFRLPDRPTRPPLRRLPGPLPGVGVFEQYPLTVNAAEDDANEAPILLSRYQRRGARPLMLLHGYSASGTTFAHEALRPSFAAYLWHQGWDVWVVDLRSSAGLASSTRAWTFEEIANADIPLAVDHIFHATGGLKISVVAHCMGAAMFSMAVLSKDHRDYPLRNVMKDRIDRVVMTQIGPGMIFSAGNTFRAYVVSYLKPFLPLARFDFRVDAPDSLANQVIDRLLNLLPYPEEEFAIENPAWPPWKRTEFVGLRHRMDLLYGRDFSLGNVQAGFLEHLDAQFGPLNLDTLSQVIAFARWRNITDKRGRNLYFHRKRLQDRWTFDTLSLHGADNGLSSIATLSRNKRIFRDAGVNYQTRLLPGFGHQDIWASPDSEKRVFKEIHAFLAGSPQVRATTRTGSRLPIRPLLAAPPFLGPVLSLNPDRPDEVFAKIGNNPNLGPPQYILVLGVEQAGSHYRTAGFNLEDGDLKRSIQIVPTPRLDDNGMIDLAIRVPDDSPDLLVLMVHDEHPDLLSGSFGEPPFSLDHRHRFLSDTGAESEPGADARLRDAVCAVMDKAASRLTPAVIPARTVAYRQNQEGGRSDVCVVFASCQFASTVFDKEVAWASYNRLARRLDEDRSFAPGLLLLLGDQVYVDPTAGFADPRQDYDKYIKPHIAFLSNDAVQKVLSSIPTYMMLDDHEIGDNWQPNELDAGNLTRKRQGESAFRSFQFNSLGLRDPDGFWGEVSKSPIPVFMLNTRTEREPRTLGNLEHARLISDTQLAAVTGWLGRQAPGAPKIVTFSSLPLPRHRPQEQFALAAIHADGVDGYPATLDALLSYIAEQRLGRIVFLSGDEHRAITARIRLLEGSKVVAEVVSIQTTALYSPFPFANAVAADFVTRDRFEFGDGRFLCEVDARVHSPGEGFTLLNFKQEGKGWQLNGTFEATAETFCFTL